MTAAGRLAAAADRLRTCPLDDIAPTAAEVEALCALLAADGTPAARDAVTAALAAVQGAETALTAALHAERGRMAAAGLRG